MKSNIYIIILNYNGWRDTIECITSLLEMEPQDYKIVCVDNCSTDDSVVNIKDFISSLEQDIVFLHSSTNNGFAAGNNIGIRYALEQDDYRYIWLLNNDTVVDKYALSFLIKRFEDDKTIGAVGSKLVYMYDKKTVQGLYCKVNKFFATTKFVTDQNVVDEDIDSLIGASMLLSRDCIEKVGLLPEDYFLYYEDAEYSCMIKKAGFKLSVAPSSIVYHKEGGTTGLGKGRERDSSEILDLLSIKNRLKYAKRCLGNNILVRIGLLMSIINRLRRSQYRRAYEVLKMMFVFSLIKKD